MKESNVQYEIKRSPAGVSLWRITKIARGEFRDEIDPTESQKICNHSPDGFEFGYGGSGPSQLAIAILLDFARKDEAQVHYQNFKWKFIATLPKEGGIITGMEIMNWLNKEEKNEK